MFSDRLKRTAAKVSSATGVTLVLVKMVILSRRLGEVQYERE
jgi:hypothetical protein